MIFAENYLAEKKFFSRKFLTKFSDIDKILNVADKKVTRSIDSLNV